MAMACRHGYAHSWQLQLPMRTVFSSSRRWYSSEQSGEEMAARMENSGINEMRPSKSTVHIEMDRVNGEVGDNRQMIYEQTNIYSDEFK